jgi:hypothetical protein
VGEERGNGRHLGHTSPASRGRITAAHEGHWKVFDTLTADYTAAVSFPQ